MAVVGKGFGMERSIEGIKAINFVRFLEFV